MCESIDVFQPWLALHVAFSDLLDAAKLGCSFCSVIRDGILLFANGEDITNIGITQIIETRRESSLGQLQPVGVQCDTRAGRAFDLMFYTADGQLLYALSTSTLSPVSETCRVR